MSSTPSYHPLRVDPAIYYTRCLILVFTIACLAIAGSDVSDFQDIDCDTPPNLSYNVATAALSLPILIYFLTSTGINKPVMANIPWSALAQVAIDVLLFILWLATAATSSFTAKDLCAACSSYWQHHCVSKYHVSWAGATASCYAPLPSGCSVDTSDDDNDNDDSTKLFKRAVSVPTKKINTAAKYSAKIGLNVAVMVLILIVLLLALRAWRRLRRERVAAASRPPAAEPQVEMVGKHDNVPATVVVEEPVGTYANRA